MRNFNWKRGLTAGGILALIILMMFLRITYEQYSKTPEEKLKESEKQKNGQSCLPIPDDVPILYSWGPEVKWDCNLQTAYNNGDLIITYADNGDSSQCESIKYRSYDGLVYKCDFEKITAH